MPQLYIHKEKVTPETAAVLVKLCPFSAITYDNGALGISSGCKMCRLCVKKGPAGVVEYIEDEKKAAVDKSAWNGIAVFADHDHGVLHNVTLELLGKAGELAEKIGQPVLALLIGDKLEQAAKTLLYEKGLSGEQFRAVLKKAQEERGNGTRVAVAQMNKNKKFQKEQLAKDGYEEIVEFYKDSLK